MTIFTKNPSIIQSIIKEELANFRFNGLELSENVPSTSRFGPAAFFQYQDEATLRPKMIIDGLTNEMKIIEPFQWPTGDNSPPFDSDRFIIAFEPLVEKSISISIITISSLFLVANLILVVILTLKVKQPFCNISLSIGNCFLSLFSLLLAIDVGENCQIFYSLALIFAAMGIFQIITSITAKIDIAKLTSRTLVKPVTAGVTPRQQDQNQQQQHHRSTLTWAQRSKMSSQIDHHHHHQITEQRLKRLKIIWKCSVWVIPCIAVSIAVAIASTGSLENGIIDKGKTAALDRHDLFYLRQSYYCYFNFSGNHHVGYPLTIVLFVLLAVVMIHGLQVAVSAKRASL